MKDYQSDYEKKMAEARREYEIQKEIIEAMPKGLPVPLKLVYTHEMLGGTGGLGFDATWEQVGQLMKKLKPVKLVVAKQTGWAAAVYLPEYIKGKRTDWVKDCAPWEVEVNQYTGAEVEWYTNLAGKTRAVKVHITDSHRLVSLRIEYKRGYTCPQIVNRDWVDCRNQGTKKAHDIVSASGGPEYPHGHRLWWDKGTTWEEVIS